MKSLALILLCLMPMAGADPLTGKWQLVELKGKPIPANLKKPFIQFTKPGGRIEGSGGCNRFGASFKKNKASIQFAAVSATMMECLGPEMKIEDEFLKSLSLKLTFKLRQGDLYFYEGNTIVMRLKR